MRWRIYYGDGTTFSDRDGSAYDAPCEGVQVIAQEDNSESGTFLMHGDKFFDSYVCWWPEEGSWQIHDLLGLHRYHLKCKGPQKVLHCENMIDTDAYWKIVGKAGKERLGE